MKKGHDKSLSAVFKRVVMLCCLLGVSHQGCSSDHTFQSEVKRQKDSIFKERIIKRNTPQFKIVGGSDAKWSQYPWQVAVYINGGFCGGSIFSESWVLTAAHCVVDEYGNKVPARHITVQYGDVDLVKGEKVKVAKSIPHPKYQQAHLGNDIALLKLQHPIKLDGVSSRKVQLPSIKMHTKTWQVGASATVTGWGSLQSDQRYLPKTLQTVSLPLVDRAKCEDQLIQYLRNTTDSNKGFRLAEDQLCAGFQQGGKDSCQGDSGGPLVLEKHAPTNLMKTTVQLGVVSWGFGCAKANAPGVYTKIASHIEWIESIYHNH